MKLNAKPFISIVIPTWNRYEEVIRATKSVNIEKYDNVEIIVCDNDSKAEISEKLEDYCSKKRGINFYKNPSNIGMTANWNQALKYASGTWISLLCSDDEYEIGGFQRAFLFLKNLNEPCLVVQNPILESSTVLKAGKEATRKLNLPIASGNFWHEDCLKNCGYFDERLKYSPDAEYWTRIATKYNIVLYPNTFAKYNLHSNNYMWVTWLKEDIIDQMILIGKLTSQHKEEDYEYNLKEMNWNYQIFFLKNSIGIKKRRLIVKKYLPLAIKNGTTFSRRTEILKIVLLFFYRKLRLNKLKECLK
jgi:glycosyltransferase involved in cell wall biosynthesis